ncbi:MAG: hypothetical protein WBP58_05305 [Chitinophagaceae bacterium]
MKIHKFLFIVLVAMASCDQTSAPKTATQDSIVAEEVKIMVPEGGCYAYMKNGDSIWLKVELFPNVATGVLTYHLSGKDKNVGTFDGRLQGDTLVADYTFRSEGRVTVRQIVFKLSATEAREAYGKMRDYEGKMIYDDLSAIDFSKGLSLDSVSCVNNDQWFRPQ